MRLKTTPALTKYVEYRITLKETEKVANDGTCVVYPYHGHANYGDCVGAEMRAKILPTLGCMVPWISADDQCLGPITRLPEHEDLVNQLYLLGKESTTAQNV